MQLLFVFIILYITNTILCESIPSFTDFSHVNILNSENLQKQVLNSKTIWLVGFTNDDDATNHLRFKMVLQELGKNVVDFHINIAFYDCNQNGKSSLKICSTINPNIIQNPITAILFTEEPIKNPYTKKSYRTPIIYENFPRKASELEKFIAKKFAPKNFHLISNKESAITLDESIHSYRKPTLIVITEYGEKSSTSILYKNIAQLYPLIDVYLYKADDFTSTLLTIEELPSVYFAKEGAVVKDDIILHSGFYDDFDELVNFIQPFIVTADSINEEETIDSPNVDVKLTSTSFNSLTFTDSSNNVLEEWFLLVHKGDIKQDLATNWKQLESLSGGVVKTGIISCDDQPKEGASNNFGGSLCNQLDDNKNSVIVQLPYGVSARKKVTSLKSKFTTFASNDIKSAIKAIGKTLPSSVVEEVKEEQFQDALQRAIYQRKLPMFYISSKGNVPSVIKQLALSYPRSIELSILESPSEKFKQSLGINKLPVLLSMMPKVQEGSESDNEENKSYGFFPYIFDPKQHGTVSFPLLSDLVKGQFMDSPFKDKEDSDFAIVEESSSVSITNFEVHALDNESEWLKYCEASYRGICVIQFLTSSTEFNDSILKSIASDKALQNAAIRYFYVDGECKAGFTEQFSVSSSSLPTLIVYAPYKTRYALFKGSMNEASVRSFVRDVAAGDIGTLPLSTRPIVDEKCSFDDIIVSDEPSADDFLAEILAEEKRAAADLKKSVEMAQKELKEKKERELKEKKEAEEAKKKAEKKAKKKKVKKSKKTQTTEL